MHDKYQSEETEKDPEDIREKNRILSSIFYSACFVLLLWIIQLIQWSADIDMSVYGIMPRKISGLAGIFSSPLIHADFGHLISNSITLFILLFGVLYFYRSSVVKVFLIIYFVDGILVWLFGRQSYHIGASGLVYGLAGFLFFSGLFRKDKRSIALSLLVVFLYGGMVWGILPVDPHISFESHLFGAITGIVCAFVFRKNDPPLKYEWEEDESEDDDFDYGDKAEEVEIDEDAEPEDFRRS